LFLLERQHGDLCWFRHGERPQQKRIHHAENGGVRANAQRQGDDGDDHKAGIFHEHARAVSNVLQ
jgi:hypothetical protein